MLDELYGAVGKGTFKIAIVGEARMNLLLQRDDFIVQQIGIYFRDTYDFNTTSTFEQMFPLGVWSKSRLLPKAETAVYMLMYNARNMSKIAEMFPSLVPVFNEDFRRYQKHHQTGGDFVVYSDVMWTKAPRGMEIPIPW
ncbi:hypothetical protein HNR39_002046 [Glaciimonas immobilis]|uniref:Uncharacterized protein n=1 Tax=Glaciimonas immobilis TaxID=728004 RepID=A0A840RUD2_9BURK|nr:hypothetical protein HAV38_00715 [Glaciimonas immobilis]MBB5200211.1 hypothetical protein [Glaciimonas immobilis]